MTEPPTGNRFAKTWRTNHAYLVDLAHRMLGDVGEAEDVVQEAFTRLYRIAPGEIDNDRGWLTVVTSRLCLDQIRSARSRRESANDEAVRSSAATIGQPPLDPADRMTLDEDVRLALFVVLQRLSPAERVAFVLHDVFSTPFETIADTLGKPVGTCRQLARRARHKIAGTPTRPNEVTRSEHREVTERFITACGNGDIGTLLDVLHPQVWGSAQFIAGSIQPQLNHGRDLVAENLIRFYGHGTTLASHPVAGEPALLAYFDRTLYAVLTLTVTGDLITKIQAVIDPTAVELPQ